MQGKNNIIDQRNKSGEYSNYPQEELLEFINKKMPKNAVFGGSMPTMATIKLVTKVSAECKWITVVKTSNTASIVVILAAVSDI